MVSWMFGIGWRFLRSLCLQLLWEEEGSDEVGVRRPEGDVALVDVHHVGLGVEAILLGGEIVGEG
jgi:hypothetical protein